MTLENPGCIPRVNMLVGKDTLVHATSKNIKDIDEALNLVSNHYVIGRLIQELSSCREIIQSWGIPPKKTVTVQTYALIFAVHITIVIPCPELL